MKPIRKNNPGLCCLLQFWEKYCALEEWHIQWARKHIKVIINPPNGKILSYDGEKQKNIYFVAWGLLAN